jgi:hypothetical protein
MAKEETRRGVVLSGSRYPLSGIALRGLRSRRKSEIKNPL